MAKMKVNTVLEKKLEELESLLEEFGTSGGGEVDLLTYREIELRFIFTKTLLTAEISSSVDDEEEEVEQKLKLACIAKRLTDLEEAFENKWTKPINEPGLEGLQSGGDVGDETGSVGPLQEESLGLDDKVVVVAGGETEEIKNNRFSGLVSFGLVGFLTGMVSYYGYVCYQMDYDDLTPT